MACACTHSLRMVTKTTICLDIFYDTFGLSKNPNKDALLDSSIENAPLVSSSTDSFAPEKNKNTMVYACFFLAGIAISLCWNAFAFIVPYWILKYDSSIWQDFVVCYNAPGFPILVLQLFTDEVIAKRIGTRRAYILRMCFALLLISALTAAVPLTQRGMILHREYMIGFTLLIGIAVGCGHGWTYSLVSYFPSKAVAYLGAGGGMSTILIIVLTVVQHYPDDETDADLFKLTLYYIF